MFDVRLRLAATPKYRAYKKKLKNNSTDGLIIKFDKFFFYYLIILNLHT